MKMFKRSLVASSIIASLCVTPAAFADDIQVQISNSLLDTYTDKYEEADLVVMKLSDIRVAAMAYWAENESYPGVINDLVADSYYFGTFTTTFGSVIDGTNNINSYAITIDLPTPQLASYVASNVNGTFSGNTVTLEFGLPMSAIANNVSLSRFDDPTNPDLNRMGADINMDGNNIDNAGSVTASNVVINGDLSVTNGANTLTMDANGLTYNGSAVVTEDNIAAFADTSDLVSKTEDAVMNGAYTIQGVGSSLNIGADARINFTQSDSVSYIDAARRGVQIGYGGNPLLEIGDGAFGTGLRFNPSYTSSVVSLNANKGGFKSKLYLNDRAVLKSAGGQTWIGADDGRVISNDGASISTNLVAADGGRVNLIVGQNGLRTPDYALIAGNDFDGNAYTSLMYNSDDRLSTNRDGVNVNGAITANGAGGNYLNLSESLFTYQGNDVLTAGNFMNYAASIDDAVSKTQDGILRGLYTIDGLEEDGVTPSGAGLKFINDAFIDGNLLVKSENNVLANINASNITLATRFSGSGTGIFLNSVNSIGLDRLILSRNNAKLYSQGGNTFIGSADKRINASGMEASSNVYIGASNEVLIGVQDSGVRTNNTVLRAYSDISGMSVVDLQYEAQKRLSTNNSGIDIAGNFVASYDSDADGIADTEYFNLSETAFTYNGADVITAANIGTYAATAEDVVSKTQDGTLRGLYTIDGLEDDGVTPSGAGLNFINGAKLSGTIDAVDNTGDTYFTVRGNGQSFEGSGLRFQPTKNNTDVRLEGTSGIGTRSELVLNGAYARLRTIGGGNLFIGVTDERMNAFNGASDKVFIGANDEVSFAVGNSRLQNPGLFLSGKKDALNKAYVSLMYNAEERLNTDVDGVSLAGNFKASYDSDADGIADTEYFNLSETAFTYNGAEVITAANIATYAPSADDFVSKTEDGILSGRYTIDGARAGINYSNGSQISFDGSRVLSNSSLHFPGGGNVNIVNLHSSDNLIIDSGDSINMSSDDISLNSTQQVSINGTLLRLGAGFGLTESLLTLDSDIGLTSENVNITGNISLNGGISASYDANSDGSADTEYFNLSETAFTYNGAEVITSDNINTFISAAGDSVSKVDDGILRGLYTIDGLEEDGSTASNAGLSLVNGANLELIDSTFTIRSSDPMSGGEPLLMTNPIIFLARTASTYISTFSDRSFLGLGANGSNTLYADSNLRLIGNFSAIMGTSLSGSTSLFTGKINAVKTNTDGVSIIGDTFFREEEYGNIHLTISKVDNGVSINPNSNSVGSLTYNDTINVWATDADFEMANLSLTSINANLINADVVNVNTTLTVEGIDVGQWIKECEAGVSAGCSL